MSDDRVLADAQEVLEEMDRGEVERGRKEPTLQPIPTNKFDAQVDQLLDELSDLSAHWARNRANGLTPQGVKAGMLYCINSVRILYAQRVIREATQNQETNNAGQ